MQKPSSSETIQKVTRLKKKKPRWTTATIAASLGRKELLAATFKEIIFHLISLIFLSIYVFNQANASEYYLTVTLKNAFNVEEGLGDVATAEQFWKYLKHQTLGVFYGFDLVKAYEKEKGNDDDDDDDEDDRRFIENDYNQSLIHSKTIRSRWNTNLISLSSSESSLFIQNENLILGVPRIRQVKVTNSSCEIHGYFRRLFVDCYNKFGYASEDKETFGLGQPTAWVFSDASKTKSVIYWGTLTTYSGGGFYVDFPTNFNGTIRMIEDLEDNLWITRGTRAVFVDFSIYNANLNLFCICKLIFEFLPSGGVTPSFRFTPATLTPFTDLWQWVLRILLYIFCIYVLYCLCEEIREMFYFKGEYFLQFWNYVDNTVILLTFLLVVGTEYMRAVIGSYIEEIQDHPDIYGNLESPRVIYQIVEISGATLLFFVYLRTFKYLNFNRRMAQLNNTISNCSKDILGFSVMFFVAYFAYAELGYLVFGSEVDDFRSFGESMFTLLRTILGDFAYEKIHDANWIVAPIYFLSYIILVFFILLNMFLAIINDTYADVKTDIAIAPKEMEMSEYIAQKYRNLLKRFGCKVKESTQAQKLIHTNINQIRDALIKCNFDDREIEMYFTRYDIDPLKDLQRQDVEKFYEMFVQEDQARTKGQDNIVTWKDFQRQDDKLAELENSLVMLGQRIHELLRSIEAIQGTQIKPLQL